MNLYAKLTDPQNGWNDDMEKAREFLKTHDQEEILLVTEVAIDRSSTEVVLSNHGHGWNSVQFTFFIEGETGLEEYDIFSNKKSLRQIYKTYIHEDF
ncbi:putative Trna.2 protein [Salmonella phage PVPSE1]|uniref:Uncharacterized protein n=2 Tax=Seunavirus TaxID=1914851 RepID=K4I5N9_9CAUD|nr:putative Trna.2 protein [Salmonella phage PVPSE1]YP_009148965.1 hypothetical protein ACQ19_gp169 [Salmonella phage SSE121]ADP02554.1 putative Trna.2 protein [Salmonella phage PVPSE1]AFU63810.1 hypothetical protein [Salmonella phage SSE121]